MVRDRVGQIDKEWILKGLVFGSMRCYRRL